MSATTTHTQVTHFRRINTSYSKCMTNKLTHKNKQTNSTKNGQGPAPCWTRYQTHSTCPTSGLTLGLGRCGARKSWPPAQHDAAVVDGRRPQCRLHETHPPGSPSGDQEGGTLCQTPAHACHMSAKSIHSPMLTLCIFFFISSGLLSTCHYTLMVTDELLGKWNMCLTHVHQALHQATKRVKHCVKCLHMHVTYQPRASILPCLLCVCVLLFFHSWWVVVH